MEKMSAQIKNDRLREHSERQRVAHSLSDLRVQPVSKFRIQIAPGAQCESSRMRKQRYGCAFRKGGPAKRHRIRKRIMDFRRNVHVGPQEAAHMPARPHILCVCATGRRTTHRAQTFKQNRLPHSRTQTGLPIFFIFLWLMHRKKRGK